MRVLRLAGRVIGEAGYQKLAGRKSDRERGPILKTGWGRFQSFAEDPFGKAVTARNE